MRSTLFRVPKQQRLHVAAIWASDLWKVIAHLLPTTMLPYLLPRPGEAIERDLYRRGICIGADGSVLQNGSRVYAVHEDLLFRLHTVDYFHGFRAGYPVCQSTLHETNFSATELIATDRDGYVVCRLRNVQLKFRRDRRAKRYADRMVQVGLLLARKKRHANRAF